MIRAAIFDLDGVIVNTANAHFLSWDEALKEQGIKLTKYRYIKNMSGRRALENAKLSLGKLANKKTVDTVIRKKTDIFFASFDQRVVLVKGIKRFLDNLQKNKILTAIATSGRKKVQNLIFQKFKLTPFFSFIVTGDDVASAKPNPQIFLDVAEKLNIPAADCIVFEDSYSGVEAAKRAGMKVVLVMTSHSQKDIPNVDMAIKDFTKISLTDIKML